MIRILFGMSWACACCYVALASGNPIGTVAHAVIATITTRP